jgi:hypothetical protein
MMMPVRLHLGHPEMAKLQSQALLALKLVHAKEPAIFETV